MVTTSLQRGFSASERQFTLLCSSIFLVCSISPLLSISSCCLRWQEKGNSEKPLSLSTGVILGSYHYYENASFSLMTVARAE